MRHQDLTINHRLESWVYANAAARTGATGFVAGDVGRIAFQTDTGQYWRLTDDSPVTWALIGPPTALPAYASLQTAASNPTGTTSAAGVMMGLAATITPGVSGKVFVTITGNLSNTTAASATFCQISYGTGSAPANGAAATGTVKGSVLSRQGPAWGSGQMTPFAASAVITGLTLGTAIWFDLVVGVTGASTGTISNVSVCAHEFP